MIQLQILSGKMAGVTWTARHFPVRIGRSAESGLQLEEAGVWDHHLTIEFNPVSGFTLRAAPGALTTVNQQPATAEVLRPGDSIEIGSARLRFWIDGPIRRGLRWNELAVWMLIMIVLVLEIGMLLQLAG